ncbi:MAG TPA: metallophosphoesterase [Candidatus Elarobacter sp.]|nr:metallophosphoesterase [Candidatus Elarobacter sp.]
MMLAAVLSAWLQYGADGAPHARAVVSDAACPTAVVDGRAQPMTRRAGREAAFEDLVCDVAVAPSAKHLAVGGHELPPPAHDPRTIAVMGDTGCRISALVAQACNDPNAWPFPQVARAIAAAHPDLVVHVGDYLYRERGCPPLARCADSPHGDDAPAWYADFLAPAAPMFAAAPLVLLRGNHEECDRNGAGWFRYLDARGSTACTEDTDPYAVDLGDLRIVTFDSAVAEDRGVDAAREPIYRRQFAQVRALAKGTSWFVTHRPPYLNSDERAAMGEALAPFDAVLAGHIHFFATMNVATLPPLVINGEGGTQLEPNYAAFLGLSAGELHVQGDIFGSSHHGFALYTRTGAGWTISLRDPDGSERAHCTLAHRAVGCAGDTK